MKSERYAMNRVFNFSAGPSLLPLEVLQRAQEELLSLQGSGMSVMEISHRSSLFRSILENTESLLREILGIPEHYRVLFIQGGASLQFSMVPLNLLKKGDHAFYVHTGTWSKKAYQEAVKVGDARILASSEDQDFNYIPSIVDNQLSKQTNYIHITTNNTIEGTRFTSFPETMAVPLVADMSSNILSEQMNLNHFGLIYAGTQKNLGIAGLTVVIIKEDLLSSQNNTLPTMLNYQTYAKTDSLYNTPPTFSIYMPMLVLEWIKEQGSLAAIEKMNLEKAGLLYQFLDQSNLFFSKVHKNDRSITNIPYFLKDASLNKIFLEQAWNNGFHNLKGHRSIGGMRASIYNGMPISGVLGLVEFMKEFERRYG